MKFSSHTKGLIGLIFLAFGFGLIAITTRYLSARFALFQQIYLTAGTSWLLSLVMFPKSKAIHKLRGIPSRDWVIMIFRVVVGYLVAVSLYRQALVLTKISNVAFIQSIPFVGVYGWFLFKEKFTFAKLLWLMVAYIGVLMIAIHDYSSVFVFGKGELFSFISAALFGLSYVVRKWQTDFLNDVEMTQILLFLSTVMLIVASILHGESWPIIPVENVLMLSIFVSGILGVANIFLINYGFRHVKAVLASNILTLESVFAMALATIFYQEVPNLKELFGGILILWSVVQMNKLDTG